MCAKWRCTLVLFDQLPACTAANSASVALVLSESTAPSEQGPRCVCQRSVVEELNLCSSSQNTSEFLKRFLVPWESLCGGNCHQWANMGTWILYHFTSKGLSIQQPACTSLMSDFQCMYQRVGLFATALPCLQNTPRISSIWFLYMNNFQW